MLHLLQNSGAVSLTTDRLQSTANLLHLLIKHTHTHTPLVFLVLCVLMFFLISLKGPFVRKMYLQVSFPALLELTLWDCGLIQPPPQGISFWGVGSGTKKSTFLTNRSLNVTFCFYVHFCCVFLNILVKLCVAACLCWVSDLNGIKVVK